MVKDDFDPLIVLVISYPIDSLSLLYFIDPTVKTSNSVLAEPLGLDVLRKIFWKFVILFSFSNMVLMIITLKQFDIVVGLGES